MRLYKEKIYTVGIQLFERAKTLVSKYAHSTPQSMSDNIKIKHGKYSLGNSVKKNEK